ncbi:MAG TPA: pantoate--beta-alanine ligase [Planctomycetota bacterium]|nr:pantoate--beta-alanine ligase [Planctomycetota bacterium]
MTELFHDPGSARTWCAAVRADGRSLGFVPTMGALHAGHLALVRTALAENDRVCVSVFVNPLQFDDRRDFERYPRDFEGDARALAEAGASMVFTGSLDQFFPDDIPALRDPGPRAAGLEGDLRPGHFAGVATIVARLFDVVRPDRAYFGQKDFQQTLVVRDLAKALGYPRIVVCPTVREASGLAMSSRNQLLSPAERETATVLYRSLEAARALWVKGVRDARVLADAMRGVLDRSAVAVEYAAVRDPEKWTRADPVGPLERGVALVAARLSSVRLIDNALLDGR